VDMVIKRQIKVNKKIANNEVDTAESPILRG
jgi:hypothetical protein